MSREKGKMKGFTVKRMDEEEEQDEQEGWNEEWKEERKVERMNNIPELICSDPVVFKDHELEPRLSDQSLIKHETGNYDDLSA